MRDINVSVVKVIFVIVRVVVVWCGVNICEVLGIGCWVYFSEVGNFSFSEVFGNGKGNVLGCWSIGR